MTDKEIQKDQQERIIKAKEDIGAILKKYELDLAAEDMIGEHTKIKVMVQFVDTKKYPKADLAQPVNPVIDDLISGTGDPIGPKKKK